MTGDRHDVAADVGHRAVTPRRIVAKGPRLRRVRHIALEMNATKTEGMANFSRVHDLVGEPDERVAQVTEADDRLGMSLGCGVFHFLRVRRRCRQRLFAPHGLSRGKGRQRHWLVQGVRRRNRDHVHSGIGYERAPVPG